jgi:hypothetical protein
MRSLTPRQVMVPLVILATAAHVAVRWSVRDSQPVDVSPRHAGEVVAPSTLPATASLLPGHCLQLIVFSPDCPFCQHAADREKEALSEASRDQRLWYTETETATLSYFTQQHLHRQPGISAELVKELKIQAVPALFVLSPEGQIRWVGSYFGDESDQELAGRCAGDRGQGSKI